MKVGATLKEGGRVQIVNRTRRRRLNDCGETHCGECGTLLALGEDNQWRVLLDNGHRVRAQARYLREAPLSEPASSDERRQVLTAADIAGSTIAAPKDADAVPTSRTAFVRRRSALSTAKAKAHVALPEAKPKANPRIHVALSSYNVQGDMSGRITSYNPVDGEGFIDCVAAQAMFESDVYVNRDHIGRCRVHDDVTFNVVLNGAGCPQARKVRRVIYNDDKELLAQDMSATIWLRNVPDLVQDSALLEFGKQAGDAKFAALLWPGHAAICFASAAEVPQAVAFLNGASSASLNSAKLGDVGDTVIRAGPWGEDPGPDPNNDRSSSDDVADDAVGADVAPFKIGDLAVIRFLESKPEWNGRVAKLLNYFKAKDRWVVSFGYRTVIGDNSIEACNMVKTEGTVKSPEAVTPP